MRHLDIFKYILSAYFFFFIDFAYLLVQDRYCDSIVLIILFINHLKLLVNNLSLNSNYFNI